MRLTLLFILVIPFKSRGQDMPDSLILALETTYDKELKMNTLQNIMKETFDNSLYDTTIYYAKQKSRLARIVNNKKAYADAIWAIAISYRRKDDLINAGTYLFEAYELFGNMNDQQNLAFITFNMGQVFKDGNNFEEGIFYLQKALNLFQLEEEQELVAKTHYELARGYVEINCFDKSLFHLERCSQLTDFSKNPTLISRVHNYLGINYYKLKEYDKAIEEYSKSRKFAIGLMDYDKKAAIAYNNIGEVYIEKKDYENARSYFKKALALKRELGDKELLAGSLINLAKLALLENQPVNAISFLEETVATLDKNRLSNNLKEASLLLSEAYKRKEHFTASDYHKIMNLNREYAQSIHELKQAEFKQSMLSTISENKLRGEALYLGEKVNKARHFSLWLACICLLVITGFLIILYYQKRKFKSFIHQMWKDVKDI